MFHPQINYSMLLIEKKMHCLFFFSWPVIFSSFTPELECGALATLSHLFLMLLCDSHTKRITLNSPSCHFLKGLSFFYRLTSTDEMDESLLLPYYICLQ